MIPMDPAKAVMNVRPFFVIRLLNESASAVRRHDVRRWLVACTRMLLCGRDGVGVGLDLAVAQVHDAGRVLIGELRIVGDHDDEAVVGDFGEQVHDLHARLGVEGAGGLVGQQDLGVVDERAGDGHALHLTAESWAGVCRCVGQADVGQRFHGTVAALLAPDARQRERKLHVGEDRLVRDEVVALEHETDAVVAVGIPIAIDVW